MGYKILIASMSDLIRFGVRTALKDECNDNDVYEATTSEELRNMLMSRTFNLAIIQECLVADMHFLAKFNFILITTDPNIEMFQQAYQHRAQGYVSENINANLLRSILYLDKGTFFLDPLLFPWMMEYMLRNQETKEELNLLSPREREIFSLMQVGTDRRTVARNLHISDSTLKTHIKNINRKMDHEPAKKPVLHLEATRA